MYCPHTGTLEHLHHYIKLSDRASDSESIISYTLHSLSWHNLPNVHKCNDRLNKLKVLSANFKYIHVVLHLTWFKQCHIVWMALWEKPFNCKTLYSSLFNSTCTRFQGLVCSTWCVINLISLVVINRDHNYTSNSASPPSLLYCDWLSLHEHWVATWTINAATRTFHLFIFLLNFVVFTPVTG